MTKRNEHDASLLDRRVREIKTRLLGELAKARRATGWSAEELVRKVGVDRETISKLEEGIGSVETLGILMDVLGFQLARIAAGRTLGEQLAKARLQRVRSVASAAFNAELSEAAVQELENDRGSVESLFKLLAVVAPNARRRAPERAYWGQGDKADRDSRFTPATFMEAIYGAFGPVDLDPCAHPLSPVVAARRFIPAQGGDGLLHDWSGRLAFVNPPFSAQLKWLQRGHEQWAAGSIETVIFLVPVRPDSRFFHEKLRHDADLFLLQGRLRFASPRGNEQPTPFSLWIVALGATAEQKARFAKLVQGCWFRAADAAPVGRLRLASRRKTGGHAVLASEHDG